MDSERLTETKAEMTRSLTALYLMLPEDVADHHWALVKAHIDAQAERIKDAERRMRDCEIAERTALEYAASKDERIRALEARLLENTDPDEDEARLRQRVREMEDRIKAIKAAGITYCAYCGAEFEVGDADGVGKHIATCEKHPMVHVRRETAAAIAREAREVSSMWYGRQVALPDLEAICRAHGADV